MNLSPRPSTPYLVPFCVVGIALGVANTLQLAEVYACARNTWAAWCAVVMMGCTCGLTLVIAVALRPVEPEPPAPAPQFTAEQIAAVDEQMRDLHPLPGRDQSYQATMARRHPAPWIRLSEEKLARVIPIVLTGKGSINVIDLQHICTRRELAELRQDLINHGWADERNKTAVINVLGRAGLADLLPRLSQKG